LGEVSEDLSVPTVTAWLRILQMENSVFEEATYRALDRFGYGAFAQPVEFRD
jgi:hypothetical protein